MPYQPFIHSKHDCQGKRTYYKEFYCHIDMPGQKEIGQGNDHSIMEHVIISHWYRDFTGRPITTSGRLLTVADPLLLHA
jgi:hypothetical protein